MFPEHARRYVVSGLASSPVIIARLLADATPADYDRRPDPERFTVREVLAHLADWEGVWLERIEKIMTQNHPALPGYDEGQWAIDHDYAHSDVAEQLERFRAGRAALVERMRGLSPGEWERTGQHSEWGIITVGALCALVHGHDGYHMQQIVEWMGER